MKKQARDIALISRIVILCRNGIFSTARVTVPKPIKKTDINATKYTKSFSILIILLSHNSIKSLLTYNIMRRQ